MLDEEEKLLQEFNKELSSRISSGTISWKEFLYRLAFTRDDDMDLLQLFFAILIVFFMVVFVLAGLKILTITAVAWSIFGSVFFILAISGTPSWIARLIAANGKPNPVPNEVSEYFARSTVTEVGSGPPSSDVQELVNKRAPKGEG